MAVCIAGIEHCSDVILVGGLFDLAALWQAGFHNVTCSSGNHLNLLQLRQLCATQREPGPAPFLDSTSPARVINVKCRKSSPMSKGASVE
jgi:hypothetical protein